MLLCLRRYVIVPLYTATLTSGGAATFAMKNKSEVLLQVWICIYSSLWNHKRFSVITCWLV